MDQPGAMLPATLPPRLVLFDGVCGLCDRVVQWVIDHDPKGKFSFAPLQGETAAAIRARHPKIPESLETFVLVEQVGGAERIYLRSAAAFRLFRIIGGPWKILSWLGVLPRFLTDLGYRFIAKIRYRVFGKMDSCRLPTPEERGRFLP